MLIFLKQPFYFVESFVLRFREGVGKSGMKGRGRRREMRRKERVKGERRKRRGNGFDRIFVRI